MGRRVVVVVGLVVGITFASLLAGGGFGAGAAPVRTVTVVRVVQTKVDGKDVTWWARRARANGDTMRRLRRANRDRLAIAGAYGLARAFRCIHEHEAGWRNPGIDWTGRRSPYFGGLQMDRAFMRAYGGEFLAAWGTADKWPPFVQAAVAMRAYLSGRGFGPWPLSSRACGFR